MTSDPFFAQDPIEAVFSGQFNHLPVMIGDTKDEGLLFSMNFVRDPSLFKEFEENWVQFIPLIFFNR